MFHIFRRIATILSMTLVLLSVSTVTTAQSSFTKPFTDTGWYIAYAMRSECFDPRGCPSDIGVLDLATGDVKVLEVGSIWETLAGSPVSAQIAYRKHDDSMWVIEVEEDISHQLDASGDYLVWSPQGKQIAFIEDRSVLSIINVEDNSYRQLVDFTGQSLQTYGDPVWSPDGQKIAIMTISTELTDVGINPSTREIHVIDTFNSSVLYRTKNDHADSLPAWSNDSQKVAFWSQQDTGSGSTVVALSTNVVENFLESINPQEALGEDGFIFQFSRDGADLSSIHIKNVATGEIEYSLTSPSLAPIIPSPDGNYLMVNIWNYGDHNVNVMCIYGVKERATRCYTELNMYIWSIPTWVKKP